MKERPILFSAPMVRALLAGTKTQTRRAVKPQPERTGNGGATLMWAADRRGDQRFGVDGLDVPPGAFARCPYGAPGDRLVVREAWRTAPAFDDRPPRDIPAGSPVRREADGPPQTVLWGRLRPGMFMPRWASRITLEVTEVRVERLQDISEADAIAEGVDRFPGCRQDDDTAAFNRIGPVDNDSFPIARYAVLWERINGAGSWDANPYVWCVSFRKLP